MLQKLEIIISNMITGTLLIINLVWNKYWIYLFYFHSKDKNLSQPKYSRAVVLKFVTLYWLENYVVLKLCSTRSYINYILLQKK